MEFQKRGLFKQHEKKNETETQTTAQSMHMVTYNILMKFDCLHECKVVCAAVFGRSILTSKHKIHGRAHKWNFCYHKSNIYFYIQFLKKNDQMKIRKNTKYNNKDKIGKVIHKEKMSDKYLKVK